MDAQLEKVKERAMALAYEVRLLELPDVREYVTHVRDADADSGAHGIHFHPYSKDAPFDVEAAVERERRRWSTPLTEVGWRRAWGLLRDNQIVGHVYFASGELETDLHRVDLGMGLMPADRGKGGGSQLLEEAIGWARAEAQIAWIDLGVFGGNLPAQRLYEKFGFIEVGRKDDRFRVDGAVVDDISMSLYVGPGERSGR